MTPEAAVQFGKDALYTVLLVAGPMLGAGLAVGLVVSILQAVTQVHEMTLIFIPKIIAVGLALALFMPWMMRIMVGFTSRLITAMPYLAR